MLNHMSGEGTAKGHPPKKKQMALIFLVGGCSFFRNNFSCNGPIKKWFGGSGDLCRRHVLVNFFCVTCHLYPLRKHPSEISTTFLLFFAIFCCCQEGVIFLELFCTQMTHKMRWESSECLRTEFYVNHVIL